MTASPNHESGAAVDAQNIGENRARPHHIGERELWAEALSAQKRYLVAVRDWNGMTKDLLRYPSTVDDSLRFARAERQLQAAFARYSASLEALKLFVGNG